MITRDTTPGKITVVMFVKLLFIIISEFLVAVYLQMV